MSGELVTSSSGAIKLMDEETKELRVMAQAGVITGDPADITRYDLPLKIGERTIGVFELARIAGAKLGDNERGLVRAVRNARDRIDEDPIRALRGVRLAATRRGRRSRERPGGHRQVQGPGGRAGVDDGCNAGQEGKEAGSGIRRGALAPSGAARSWKQRSVSF